MVGNFRKTGLFDRVLGSDADRALANVADFAAAGADNMVVVLLTRPFIVRLAAVEADFFEQAQAFKRFNVPVERDFVGLVPQLPREFFYANRFLRMLKNVQQVKPGWSDFEFVAAELCR